jgi:predicted phosphodiesterase
MSLSDELANLALAGTSGSDTKQLNTPDGWRPRLEVDADGGFLISTPRTAGDLPDASDLLADFDLDPSQWLVTGVRRSRWQRYDGEWLEAARVTLAPARATSTALAQDAEQLISALNKWRPNTRQKPHTGSLSGLFCVGDTQFGKDAGDGTAGTVRRMGEGLEASIARFKELTKTGRDIGQVVLPQLGDCIEGSTSQKGGVLGRSDLSVTEQVRIGRRVLLNWIKNFAPLVETVIVPVVPGNHDEPHRIVLTDPIDSWQIEIVSAVADACAENPALAHVQFRFPERDNLALAMNLSGSMVGFVHGHQARDMTKWWEGQATGRTPVGGCDVLISAHFHHYKVSQVGPRLWIQTPAMDGGSPWFRNTRGLESPTGIVSLVVGDDYDPRRDLVVLAGENR